MHSDSHKQSNLAARPIQDGLRVPYVAGKDLDRPGRFKFSSNNSLAWNECWQKDLCAICGAPLDTVRCVFVQEGPVRASLEPAMHVNCGQYAIEHCPHLGRDVLTSTVVYRDQAGAPRYYRIGLGSREAAMTSSTRTSSRSFLIPAWTDLVATTLSLAPLAEDYEARPSLPLRGG